MLSPVGHQEDETATLAGRKKSDKNWCKFEDQYNIVTRKYSSYKIIMVIGSLHVI